MFHYAKNIQIDNLSGPYFHVFGLSMEIYSVAEKSSYLGIVRVAI